MTNRIEVLSAKTQSAGAASLSELDGTVYQIATFSTELGWMSLLGQRDRLCKLSFGLRHADDARAAVCARLADASVVFTAWQSPLVEHLIEQLTAYAEGDPQDFGQVELRHAVLTPFGQRITALTRTIPHGQTWSYAELAKRAGHPGAARAVGSVMAKNQIPLIVPCHRVVGSQGSLGGFSAPGGLSTKRRLLQLEANFSAGVGSAIDKQVSWSKLCSAVST